VVRIAASRITLTEMHQRTGVRYEQLDDRLAEFGVFSTDAIGWDRPTRSRRSPPSDFAKSTLSRAA
jgi:hypothetical protein